MSKVVIDARELRTSSGRYVERLLHYLQQVDQQNEYKVLLKPNDMDWQPDSKNFEKIACPYKEFTFNEQFDFMRQVKGLGADLVHFAYAQQPIWYRGRTVTTIHDLTTLRFNNPDKNLLVFKFKQLVYGYVVKRAVKKASAVITPSQFVKDDLAKFAGIDPKKIIVTYESADPITDASEPVVGLENQKFIMYLGRPTPHKNLGRLVEAFAKLQSEDPNLKLVLGGKTDANYKRLEDEVQKRGLKNVVFTGFLSEGQLKWLYENCVAYVFPSLSEGFGLPGLEAMQHGAPVVSSNATCLPEIYGDAAHYFDPLDVNSMAGSISEVLTSKELRDSLVQKGYEQVKKYSWQRMAKQTLEIYRKALS